MKLRFAIGIGVLFLIRLLLPNASTVAQEAQPELDLSLWRDFGYASGTGDIQGTFSLRVNNPENLVKVVFLIDGNIVAEDTEAPFRYQFNTGAYPVGVHTLSAVGYTQDGREIYGRTIQRNFVSADEAQNATLRIVAPLLGIILGSMALSFALPALFRRGKPAPLGAKRNYGLAGGAICKHCERPFALNFFAPNLLAGKFDRCPHCGKWGIQRRQPLAVLRAAEQAELDKQVQEELPENRLSEEEKLKKALDESRYQDV